MGGWVQVVGKTTLFIVQNLHKLLKEDVWSCQRRNKGFQVPDALAAILGV